MTAVSKNLYTDILHDIVNKYNNTYHRTITIKPIKVKDNTYIDSIKEFIDKDPKYKVGDHVITLKYKNIFVEGYIPNCSEEVFVIKEVRNTAPRTYVINDVNGEDIIGTFYEEKLQKNNKSTRIQDKKMIKRKGYNLYVKWKGYDN